MTSPAILIITDDPETLRILQQIIGRECTGTLSNASSRESALQCFPLQTYDLVLMDARIQGSAPLHLIQEIRILQADPTLILFGLRPEEILAPEILEDGVCDLLPSPLNPLILRMAVRRGLERSLLLRERRELSQESYCHRIFSRIAGQSPTMKEVLDAITMAATSDTPVLITGESGTGKELAARTLHQLSPQASGVFIRVHCPSIGDALLENDLFGDSREEDTEKRGFLDAALGGTLFLDEIGDISLNLQKRLTDFLQNTPESATGRVRLLASTRHNLEKKIQEQQFSKAFYRILAARHIHLPPLRKRPEDIPPLAQALLEKNCHKLKKHGKYLAPDLMKRLAAHPWEGNIRELENTLIQGILFSNAPEIGLDDVQLSGPKPLGPCSAALNQAHYKDAKEEALKGFNQTYIGRLLKRNHGNVSRAAKACGLERQALQQIMRRYEISPAPYRPQTGCDGGYPE